MTLLKVLNKKRNITYVYESQSKWDPEKKQSKSTRKLIGKIDPKTGEIIQTGPRGRKKSQKSCRKKNGEAATESVKLGDIETEANKSTVLL